MRWKALKDENRFSNLVNGKWIFSDKNEAIKLSSPVDGSLLGYIPSMARADIDEAASAAKRAQEDWRTVPVYKKAEYLYRTADLLEENEAELVDTLVMEIAKDKKSAVSEIRRSADLLRYTADVGKSLQGEAIFGDSFPGGSRNKMSCVMRVPVGTVLAISRSIIQSILRSPKLDPR